MITVVQTTQGGADGTPASPVATANFLGSVTPGNRIIVCVRNGGTGSTISAPQDSEGVFYVTAKHATGQDPEMGIYYPQTRVVTGGSAFSVSVGMSVRNYPWIFALEVSGLDESVTPLDVADSATGTGLTDCLGPSLTTTMAEELIVCAISQSAFASYTAGAGFTLLDGTIPANANNFGGVQYLVTSSPQSGFVPHITSDVSNQYTFVAAAFKGVSPAGPPAVVVNLYRRSARPRPFAPGLAR